MGEILSRLTEMDLRLDRTWDAPIVLSIEMPLDEPRDGLQVDMSILF